MVQQASSDEPIATNISRLPQGYVFVPKGNVYITGKVRKLTKHAGKTLWRVQVRQLAPSRPDNNTYLLSTCYQSRLVPKALHVRWENVKGQNMGLRCPSDIFESVLQLEAATRADREENVIKKDLRDSATARAAVLRLFPRIPESGIDKVVDRAFEKASGRVGRTTLIGLDERVAIAVWAHIRHGHTAYDNMLDRKSKEESHVIDKEEVRRQIRPLIKRTFFSWGGTEQLMRSSGLAHTRSKASWKTVRRRSITKKATVKKGSKTMSTQRAKKVTVTYPVRSSPRTKTKSRLMPSRNLAIRNRS